VANAWEVGESGGGARWRSSELVGFVAVLGRVVVRRLGEGWDGSVSDVRPLGVILTGGRATRLQPLSLELPKALVPVLNRPLIAYALDRLAECGVSEVVVVVGPGDDRSGSVAREVAPEDVSIEVAVQAEPKGPGDALAQVPVDVLRGRHVAVIAVDALLLGGDMAGQFESWLEGSVDGWLPLAPTDRPSSMGIAQLSGDRVTEFVEKPEQPKGNLASVAWWLLGPVAVERILDDPVVNAKGELEISGTLASLIRTGHAIGGAEFDGEWLDTGTLSALLSAQARLLEDEESSVLVAADAVLEDCELGSNVVVGAGCVLTRVKLSNALVAAGAVVSDLEDEGVVITPSGVVGRGE
jgi:glucose-1-phosphate thymidylyltransferase